MTAPAPSPLVRGLSEDRCRTSDRGCQIRLRRQSPAKPVAAWWQGRSWLRREHRTQGEGARIRGVPEEDRGAGTARPGGCLVAGAITGRTTPDDDEPAGSGRTFDAQPRRRVGRPLEGPFAKCAPVLSGTKQGPIRPKTSTERNCSRGVGSGERASGTRMLSSPSTDAHRCRGGFEISMPDSSLDV